MPPPDDSHDAATLQRDRLVIVRGPSIDVRRELIRDVRAGFARKPYAIPPKHFYDAKGAALFDRICETPEYYLTRSETSLLVARAKHYVETVGAREMVELGSGAARKTRLLLEALVEHSDRPLYVPIDVTESMLVSSAKSLLADYPTLRVLGVVGDYRSHLADAERTGRRLVSFLGSSIGNYAPGQAEGLLADVRRQMHDDDALLIGFDLVKDIATLERAYNDAQGITAAFNLNVLTVIDRELDADFDPARFEHVAFFNAASAQVEMHLRACVAHTAHIRALEMAVPFDAGDTIHTEISRKFTRESARSMLRDAGFDVAEWDVTDDGAFALVLARPSRA